MHHRIRNTNKIDSGPKIKFEQNNYNNRYFPSIFGEKKIILISADADRIIDKIRIHMVADVAVQKHNIVHTNGTEINC